MDVRGQARRVSRGDSQKGIRRFRRSSTALRIQDIPEGKGLLYAGKVRAGFTPHVRREVFEALKPLHTPKCPFVDLPTSKMSHWGAGITADEMHEMQWVKPKLLAQIRFVEFTAEGHLRHAAFLGLRSDKHARDAVRET